MIRGNEGAIELSRAQLPTHLRVFRRRLTKFSQRAFLNAYIVESRRGGGGYIRIGRVQVEDVKALT